MTDIAVDPAQISRFVDALFCHASEGGFVSLRSFYDDKLARQQNEKPVEVRSVKLNGCGLDPVVTMATQIAERAVAATRPVVVCPPIATFSSAAVASEKALLEGLTLSVELDDHAADAVGMLRAILGAPTLVVASGGEWTDPNTGEVAPKLHAHWRLVEPSQSVEEHQRLRRARALACDLVGADATSKSIVHPIRWAGTVHRKNPNRPRLARILEENTDSEIVLNDALSELEGLEALRDSVDTRHWHPPSSCSTGDADLLLGCAERIENAELPWAAWNRIGMAFWRASQGSEVGLAAFRVFSAKSAKDDEAVARARWNHFADSPPDRIGIGTLVHEARKADPYFRRRNKTAADTEEPNDDQLGDFTHDTMARRMGEKWASVARHVAQWGKWLHWSGSRWAFDDRLQHMTHCRDFLRNEGDRLVARALKMADQEKDEKKAEGLVAWAKDRAKVMRSGPFIAHVVSLARSNSELAAGVEEWDRDPWSLGTPGGTVELRTGRLRPATPQDCITKSTAVAPATPGTPAPVWQSFLERIFKHDPELVPFVRRAIGYALIGSTDEHVLFFNWGQGGNGKGVLLNSVSGMLGDYATVAPQDLLLVTQSDRHPCDMAMLRGARFVTAQELGTGRAWDEPKLKSLTGGDAITARFMRQDFFTYQPAFTLFVAGNHKPRFKGVDQAIRRRLLLLPFLQNIPDSERDPALPNKLRAEWPAILRWAIEGCLEYQRIGLQPPAGVRVATDNYLNAEDDLGQWLDDCCIVSARIDWTSLGSLYASYTVWAEARGQHPGTLKGLSKNLDERGFYGEKRAVGMGFKGVGLAAPSDANDANDGNPLNGRIDPLGARAGAQYREYVADRHFRHSDDDDQEIVL
ncbi:MAG: phage/plasmid primase, P4 family [Geminicoccaceae bacterium]